MLTDITLGQYFPGNSVLHSFDPRMKIIGTLIFIVSVFFAASPLSYVLVAAFIILSYGLSKLPLSCMYKSLRPLWAIILFTMAVHVFTTPGEPLWQYGFIKITGAGIYQGVFMTLRLAYLIVFSALLTYTTSPIALTDGIERLLNPFKRFGVPAHELAMMMTIAMRFIPTLLEETDRIIKAQTARGANFVSGNLWQRGKNMVPLLVPLFISAFRRADELATAMEARCYRGGEGRTRLHKLKYTWRDGAALVCVLLMTTVLAVMRWAL